MHHVCSSLLHTTVLNTVEILNKPIASNTLYTHAYMFFRGTLLTN